MMIRIKNYKSVRKRPTTQQKQEKGRNGQFREEEPKQPLTCETIINLINTPEMHWNNETPFPTLDGHFHTKLED